MLANKKPLSHREAAFCIGSLRGHIQFFVPDSFQELNQFALSAVFLELLLRYSTTTGFWLLAGPFLPGKALSLLRLFSPLRPFPGIEEYLPAFFPAPACPLFFRLAETVSSGRTASRPGIT
jgi:membrane-bound metal-dependent hydrolase YbcI (DUF457 family)